MKASELRIGNYVKCDSIPEVGILKISVINKDFVNGCNIELIKPIPLTEECLLKFGFTKEYACEEWFYEKYFDGMDSIRVLQSDFSVGTYVNQKIAHAPQPSIMFLHQLQNLYFALTNEELTYEQQK